MAMIACKECGKEISSKAAACPACGAPRKTKPIEFSIGGIILLVIVIGVGIAAFVNSGPETSSGAAPAPQLQGIYYMTQNSPACFEKNDAEVAVNALRSNDMRALLRLMSGGKCINIPKGTVVSIIEQHPIDGVSQITQRGDDVELWVAFDLVGEK